MNEHWNEIMEKVKTSKKILLSCHANPDTDAISSVVAMCLFLEGKGVKVDVVTQGRTPWEVELVEHRYKIPKINQRDIDLHSYDLFFIFDTAVLSQLGPLQSIYHGARKNSLPIINIDHHEVNSKFGDYNLLDFDAAATCEILYNLFQYENNVFTKDLAHILLRGIFGDTDILRTFNVTPKTMRVSADLVALGANRISLTEQTSFLDFSRAKIWSMVLEKMQLDQELKSVVYSVADQEIVGDGFDGESALDGVTNFMRDLKGIKLAILFIQRKEEVKISFRSKSTISSLDIAKRFGGGGHFAAAGCEFPQQRMEDVIPLVLRTIKDFMKE